MSKIKWESVSDCNDEMGNPTVWATKVKGECYGSFIWIEKQTNTKFYVTVCDPEWRTLMICKSSASAKRWVSMNIKEV